MFMYEAHCHTNVGSACGKLTPEEVADFFLSLGYDGIFITDHFFNGSSAIDKSLPWNEKIDIFYSGYERAKARGKEIGLDVFFGFEYNFNHAEFLIYGLDKEWLLENSDICDIDPCAFLERVRQSGGFSVQAHPYRVRSYIKYISLFPESVDALEILNTSHPDGNEFDNRAKFLAQSYSLPGVCGSDTHRNIQKHFAAMQFETKLADERDYAARVKSGDFAIREFRVE